MRPGQRCGGTPRTNPRPSAAAAAKRPTQQRSGDFTNRPRRALDFGASSGLEFRGILRDAREELLLISLEDPARRDITRHLGVGGCPSFEQFISSNDLKVFTALIQESFIRESVHKSRCTHDGHIRGLGKVRRVSNRLSGHGNKRLRKTLSEEDLQHPLVQVGK